MDINALLENLKALATEVTETEFSKLRTPYETVEELAAGVLDLDRWITMGGFLPDAWREAGAK